MSSFAKNVLKLFSGNVLSYIVIMGTMPLVTRLYTPGDFGIFAVLLSVLMILGPVANLNFNTTIILPGDRNESLILLSISCLSSFVVSLVLFILVALYKSGLLTLGIPDLRKAGNYLWIIPLGVFLRGAYLSFSYWAVRQKNFKSLAVSRLIEALANRSFVLSTGVLYPLGCLGLILGRFIGTGSALICLARSNFQKFFREVFQPVSLGEMKRLAARYKDFPLYGSGSALLKNIGKELPIFILVASFAPEAAGLYALGVRTIRIPMLMIANSLFPVFLEKASSLRNDRAKLARETLRVLKYLTYLVLPFILILIALGDRIFGLVFGPKWSEAGRYVQIMAPAFFLTFLYRPLNAFFIVFERQRERLVYDILMLFGKTASLLAAISVTQSPQTALLAMSATTCFLIICASLYLFKLLGIQLLQLVVDLVGRICLMIPFAIVLVVVKLYMDAYLFMPALVLSVAILAQAMLFVLLDPWLKQKTRDYIGI
jgi:O-antigen/teichoic acid export membrane protein